MVYSLWLVQGVVAYAKQSLGAIDMLARTVWTASTSTSTSESSYLVGCASFCDLVSLEGKE